MNEVNHPFWVIVNKEISDHVKSWRFIILICIIALTCIEVYKGQTYMANGIMKIEESDWMHLSKIFLRPRHVSPASFIR